MVGAVIVVPVATNLAAALVAVLVGARLFSRRPEGDAGRAVRRFSAWWFGLAGFIVANQVAIMMTAAGVGAPALFSVLAHAANAILMVALWGLVSYVLYLFTGKRVVFPVVSVLYAIQLAWILAWTWSWGPAGLELTEGGPRTIWARREPTPGESGLFALAFLLPPILTSIALGVLRFRTRDATSRYRMMALSIGIFVWFVGAIVITASGEPTPLKSIGGPIVGTICMLLIVSAYFPTPWLRRRGVEPFGGLHREPPELSARRQAMLQRVRELV